MPHFSVSSKELIPCCVPLFPLSSSCCSCETAANKSTAFSVLLSPRPVIPISHQCLTLSKHLVHLDVWTPHSTSWPHCHSFITCCCLFHTALTQGLAPGPLVIDPANIGHELHFSTSPLEHPKFHISKIEVMIFLLKLTLLRVELPHSLPVIQIIWPSSFDTYVSCWQILSVLPSLESDHFFTSSDITCSASPISCLDYCKD